MESEAKSLQGNTFSQVGFERVEAVHLGVRSQLMTALVGVIRDRGLSQRAAASLFGVSQPRVSDLVRGRIERFSCDMLIKMLTRAGFQVRIEVCAAELP